MSHGVNFVDLSTYTHVGSFLLGVIATVLTMDTPYKSVSVSVSIYLELDSHWVLWEACIQHSGSQPS